MTTAQVVKMSVTSNGLSKDYPHADDHAKQITEVELYCGSQDGHIRPGDHCPSSQKLWCPQPTHKTQKIHSSSWYEQKFFRKTKLNEWDKRRTLR